jgi:hypothetical protein
MPIEIRKTKGIAKLLKKWNLAILGSRSSPARIGPSMIYHHSKANNRRARPAEAA